jgi:HPt (histidine-containing phosphotransfer) domain-containing protein
MHGDASVTLALSALDVVAPFNLLVDPDGGVRHLGPGLAQACPDLRPGAPWDTALVADTPGMATTVADLRHRVGTTFDLRHRATGLRWRGTVLDLQDRADLLLVGTPQFADAEALATSGLTELDFAPGDPTFALFARLASARPARAPIPAGLIDETQLERLTGIPGKTHHSLAADLLAVFVQRFAPSLAALRQAAATGDPEALRAEAHTFKGAALTVGALAVGELCHAIETDAREGRVEHASERLDAIEARWAESAPFLWTIVDRRRGRTSD